VATRAQFADEKMQKVGLLETDRLYFDLYCSRRASPEGFTHAGSDKVYYVLSGRATVRVGEEQGADGRPGRAGALGRGPRCGQLHGEPLTLLVFMAPKPAH
jgi:hypothetical protein